MENIDAYIKDIIERAEREASSIIDEAERSAQEIIQTAEKRARAEAFRRARERVDTEKNRIIDERLRELISEKAKIKKSIIDKLKGLLQSQLEDVVKSDPDRYSKFLVAILERAIKELDSDRIVVSGSSRDLEFIRSHKSELERALSERAGRDISIELGETLNVVGGIIVSSGDGSKSFGATFDSIVEYIIDKHKERIVRQLGLITQNRFRALIRNLFSRVSSEISVKDTLGREVSIVPCSIKDGISDAEVRVDFICVPNNNYRYALLVTIGRLTEDKLNRFIKGLGSLQGNTVGIAICFSGFDDSLKDRIISENIYVFTKREIEEFDRKVGAGLF